MSELKYTILGDMRYYTYQWWMMIGRCHRQQEVMCEPNAPCRNSYSLAYTTT
jgi:hypothetical protein